MQITIEQKELEVAVRQYVQNMGITAHVDNIDFSSTRGDAGVIASISISATEKPVAQLVTSAPENVADVATEDVAEDDDVEEGTSLFG